MVSGPGPLTSADRPGSDGGEKRPISRATASGSSSTSAWPRPRTIAAFGGRAARDHVERDVRDSGRARRRAAAAARAGAAGPPRGSAGTPCPSSAETGRAAGGRSGGGARGPRGTAGARAALPKSGWSYQSRGTAPGPPSPAAAPTPRPRCGAGRVRTRPRCRATRKGARPAGRSPGVLRRVGARCGRRRSSPTTLPPPPRAGCRRGPATQPSGVQRAWSAGAPVSPWPGRSTRMQRCVCASVSTTGAQSRRLPMKPWRRRTAGAPDGPAVSDARAFMAAGPVTPHPPHPPCQKGSEGDGPNGSIRTISTSADRLDHRLAERAVRREVLRALGTHLDDRGSAAGAGFAVDGGERGGGSGRWQGIPNRGWMPAKSSRAAP